MAKIYRLFTGFIEQFYRLRKLIRSFAAEDQHRESLQTGIRRKAPAEFKNDEEAISFLRNHPDNESGVMNAVRSIRNPLRRQILALDPDLSPLVRITALNHLDSTGDDVRIRIARTDFDPAVAIVAIQTLFDKSRASEALDSKLEVVRLHIANGNIAA